MSEITVLDDRYVRSYPDHTLGGAVRIVDATDAFTRAWPTDAHAVGYTLPASFPRRRLSSRAIDGADEFPVMQWLMLDADAPAHVSSEAWRDSTRERAACLPCSPLGFFTRGGARFIWRVSDRPIADWSRFFLSACVAMTSVCGLIFDSACHDWTRLARLPHTMREGIPQAHGLVCGDPAAVGLWTVADLDPIDFLAALGWLETQDRGWRSRARIFFPEEPKPKRSGPQPSGDASKALAWAVRTVAGSGNGNRNGELFGRTRWLASLVGDGELRADDVRAAMLDAAKQAGLAPSEARRTIDSALRGVA